MGWALHVSPHLDRHFHPVAHEHRQARPDAIAELTCHLHLVVFEHGVLRVLHILFDRGCHLVLRRP